VIDFVLREFCDIIKKIIRIYNLLARCDGDYAAIKRWADEDLYQAKSMDHNRVAHHKSARKLVK